MGRDNDRSTADREVRVLHISSVSFAAIVSICCSVYGLCSGLMRSYALLRAYVASDRQPPLTTTVVLKDMFFAGVVGLVGWLVIGFLAGGIMAGIYNVIARTTGGLSIRIRDGEHED